MPRSKSTQTNQTKGQRNPIKNGGIVKPTSTRQLRPRAPKKAVTAILKCAALITQATNRDDYQELKHHLEKLSEYKKKNEERQAMFQDSKARITEATGEIAATQHMMEQYPSYQLMWDFSPGTGFDQVWYDAKADAYMIVEAKGPGAKLSTGAIKGDQMSTEWVKNTATEIILSKKSSPDDIKHAQRIIDAIDMKPPPYVYGRVIEATKEGGSRELPAHDVPDGGIYHRNV